MNYPLIHKEEERYYAFEIEGKIAKVQYVRKDHKFFLTHTEVPEPLAGQGIGSALVEAVLAEVERNHWIVIPLCPFADTYIQEHPKWKHLLMKGLKIKRKHPVNKK